MSATAWTDLGDGVRVRQSALFWMNSVILSDPGQAIVVDPGVLPSELDDLAAVTKRDAPAEVLLFFTHGDWDHVLGRPWWPKARTLAHDRFAGEVRAKRDAILRSASDAVAKQGERWVRGFEPFRPDVEVSGLHFTPIGPWRTVFRDAFGHSPSMLSLHLPDRALLIAGDMLSDIEIPLLHQPIAIYRRTLVDLVPLAEHGAIRTLIPGHGSIARDEDEVLARLRRDLAYLDELESRVTAARAAGLDLERTLESLDAMDYLGKDAEYSMRASHRDNVRLVHEQPAARGSRKTSGC